jgi:hypothetical protein
MGVETYPTYDRGEAVLIGRNGKIMRSPAPRPPRYSTDRSTARFAPASGWPRS